MDKLKEAKEAAAPRGIPHFKYPNLMPFDGTKETLGPFFTYIKAYYQYYSADLANSLAKVLYTTAFLRGDVFVWFEPLQRNWLTEGIDNL